MENVYGMCGQNLIKLDTLDVFFTYFYSKKYL